MLKLQKQQRITEYSFPINIDESVAFTMNGAKLDKAILRINSRTMSVIRGPTVQTVNDSGPDDDYDADNDASLQDGAEAQSSISSREIPLDFLGGAPLRGALLGKTTVQVTLSVKGEHTPSLTMQVVPDNVTWETLGSDTYRELVVVGNEAGEMLKKTLLYHISGIVGYERASPIEAISSATSDAQKS